MDNRNDGNCHGLFILSKVHLSVSLLVLPVLFRLKRYNGYPVLKVKLRALRKQVENKTGIMMKENLDKKLPTDFQSLPLKKSCSHFTEG